VRHVRMLGLCLVAVFAVGAYLTSSAMAGPQWVQCKAASELEEAGFPFEAKQVKYVNKDCTEKSPKEARAYVLLKAPEVENLRLNYLGKETANVPFSGGSVGGGGLLSAELWACEGGTYNETRLPRHYCAEGGGELVGGNGPESDITVECEAETNTGEAEGKNKIANVHATFSGCKAFGFLVCTSKGKAEGEVETNTLVGKLGYINKASKEVGVLLQPAVKKGLFADFICGPGTETKVGVGNKKEGTRYTGPNGETEGGEEKHGGYDGIISPITPVNEMTPTFEQQFAVSYEFPMQNIPTKLEGKHIDVLEATVAGLNEEGEEEFDFMWSGAGEELTNVNTPEEAGEIKA
jgi:hypothetical protein